VTSTYASDELGRRKWQINTGTAFETYSSVHHSKWGYNSRSELESADRRAGTTPDSGSFLSPGDYDWTYDNIGNRLTYRLDSDPATGYTANDVNQYTATADPAEVFCYDDDGNMIRDGKANSTCPGTDGVHKFTWDAENRLTLVEPVTPAANDKKVAFAYDYMGRRVRKTVSTYNGSTWTEDADGDRLFIYDQWNVILVLDANDEDKAVTDYFTWGLDLSGLSGSPSAAGIHGAGGIGGLLAWQRVTASGTETGDSHL
jgi:hypothetical protein